MSNSVTEDPEIVMTDRLLVAGKKPPSLAKFLSTSTVWTKKIGDAQFAAEIAWVKICGWAPQRYNRRERPLKRECRRWRVILGVVADEAGLTDKTAAAGQAVS